ncbi:MAG: RsmB/NOP family class I SAM-dependent RNA methyltransferase [bacterium]|nr:RsmB/NOP family class I SAM-dependent RNA methyltransferase [bacterium]
MGNSDWLDKEFLSRLKGITNNNQGVVDSFECEKKPSIRINTLVSNEDDCIKVLESNGCQLEKIAGLELAYRVLNKTKRELTDIDEYKNGWFYIQSLSSMLPVGMLGEIPENAFVLDMCSAPGSKTTQIAAVMNNDGKIIANDSSRQRLYQLASNLKQCGVTNTTTSLYRGEFLWKKYGPVFDVVLLDAPCSGEGRFKLSDEKTYLDWSIKKVERLSFLQKQLIFGAVMCLKSGGVLMYSTCTFSPEENEEVVDFALEKFDGAIEVEDIDLESCVNIPIVNGMSNWKENNYDKSTEKTIRVMPNDVWDGFYIAKMRRM